MPVARGRTAPPPTAGRRRLPDVRRRAGFIDRAVPPDTAPPDTAPPDTAPPDPVPPDPAFHSNCKPMTSAGDGSRATSIREERAQPNRRAGAHTLADPVGQRKSAGPARMTGYQPDPPRTGRAEMACRRMSAGSKMRGRPAMGRIIAFAACRPRRLAIVHHFSTPYSCRCLCRQPDFAGAPTIRRRRPCRSEPGSAARPAGHPRGPRPCRLLQGSLPNRPDATSSSLAPRSAQGAGQLRMKPAAQGFRRTSSRADRAGHAGSYETETCRARAAAAARRQCLAGQGALTIRKVFPARAARGRPCLPGLFAWLPTGNVSRPLHAAGRARGPAANVSLPPFSRRAGGRRRRAANRPSRRCRRCCRGR